LLGIETEGVMSLVRLLGFTTLGCGCVVGRYREVATSREVTYVEEKGKSCGSHGHRRNHTIAAERLAVSGSVAFGGLTSKAS
jgi:hypothetical protein